MIIKAFFRPTVHSYWALRARLNAVLGHKNKHIVICGYPRSGTSLLYNMISASICRFHCEEFEKPAIRRLHRSGNYVTKFPFDIFNIDEILRSNSLDKEIYFIVVVRDIRDILTSKHPLVPDRYFIGYKSSLWPKDQQFMNWEYDAPGIERIHAEIRRSLTRNDIKIIKIRYEDIVGVTQDTQRHIAAFTQVKFSNEFDSYHTRRKKHAYRYSGRYRAKDASLVRESDAVDKCRLAKWKNAEHAGVIYREFSKYPELFDILISQGYENDREWFAEIEKNSQT